MGDQCHNEDRVDLASAIRGLTCTLKDAMHEQKSQFEWMIRHYQFATKSDIETLHEDIAMKLSQIKTAIAQAGAQQKEALTEIGTQIADLNKQIQDLKDAATDPDVTDAEFIAQIEQLQADAKSLADVVPGSPTNTNPSAQPPGTSPNPPSANDGGRGPGVTAGQPT